MMWGEQVRTKRAVSFETFDGSNDFLWRKRYVENELFITVGFQLDLADGVCKFFERGIVEHRVLLRPEKWSAQ